MLDEDFSGWYHSDTVRSETESVPTPEITSDYSEAWWSSSEPETKRRHRGRWIGALLGVVLLIIASAYLFHGIGDKPSKPDAPDSVPQIPGTEEIVTDADTDSLPRAETGTGVTMTLAPKPAGEALTLQEIYRACHPSVVAIRTSKGKLGGSLGTGIIMTADGYIITNAHVLDGAKSVTVTLLADETEHEAKLVGTDSVSDLAVLKIEAQDLKPAEFGQSDSLQVGDDVIAIGNPLGTELNGTMTNGIVSAINRNVIFGGHSMTLIQTNAAINEGNSGGPLINAYGQVVGITNMKAFTTGVEGICFAIPTSVIQPVVDALRSSPRARSAAAPASASSSARWMPPPRSTMISRRGSMSSPSPRGPTPRSRAFSAAISSPPSTARPSPRRMRSTPSRRPSPSATP